MENFILEIKNLNTSLFIENKEIKILRGISFKLKKNKALGIVGESGCGKSLTALSILRLLPSGIKITGGSIFYKGKDLVKLTEEEMQSIRGREIAIIFQDPLSALNPVISVGEQIREVILLCQNLKGKNAFLKTIDLLKIVGIPSAEKIYKSYPHQLSGGMRQRVLIAMALAGSPSLLIADEPTTALDATVQIQILELINNIRREKELSLILISHDLGVVLEATEELAVMYTGKIVELSSNLNIFNEPLHPYTIGLLGAYPKIEENNKRKLSPIKGSIPSFLDLPKGCSFYERCPKAFNRCKEEFPELLEIKEKHWVACFLYQ